MSIYAQGIIFLISINLISVLGLSLLTGFTGYFNFGQAGFMAIGAYVSGMLAKFLNVPIPISVICGMLAGGLISIPIGLPTLKLKGDYFAIATLGFSEAVRLVNENLEGFTGGARGIPGIPSIRNPIPVVFIAYMMQDIFHLVLVQRLMSIYCLILMTMIFILVEMIQTMI